MIKVFLAALMVSTTALAVAQDTKTHTPEDMGKETKDQVCRLHDHFTQVAKDYPNVIEDAVKPCQPIIDKESERIEISNAQQALLLKFHEFIKAGKGKQLFDKYNQSRTTNTRDPELAQVLHKNIVDLRSAFLAANHIVSGTDTKGLRAGQSYNSDFPYEDLEVKLKNQWQTFSLATGGFSPHGQAEAVGKTEDFVLLEAKLGVTVTDSNPPTFKKIYDVTASNSAILDGIVSEDSTQALYGEDSAYQSCAEDMLNRLFLRECGKNQIIALQGSRWDAFKSLLSRDILRGSSLSREAGTVK